MSAATSGGGSAGRAAAGAIRVGNAGGAAFTSRRRLQSVEKRLLFTFGIFLLGSGRADLPSSPCHFVSDCRDPWLDGLALLYRSYRLHRARKQASKSPKC